MAEAPKPPKKTSKGEPPLEIETSANLNKSNEGDLAPMSFKVAKEFKKDFRAESLEEELSMTEFLKKIFEQYKKIKYGNIEL